MGGGGGRGGRLLLAQLIRSYLDVKSQYILLRPINQTKYLEQVRNICTVQFILDYTFVHWFFSRA
jgi:hypothetical protein